MNELSLAKTIGDCPHTVKTIRPWVIGRQWRAIRRRLASADGEGTHRKHLFQEGSAPKLRFGSEREDVNRCALPESIPSELRLPDVAKLDVVVLLFACVPAQSS